MIKRMSPSNNPMTPPSLLSWEFHSAFFPRLLWSRLSPQENQPQGRSFNHNTGHTVMVAACMASLAVGVPMAAGPHSLIGWALVAAGLIGIGFILFDSIAQGDRPTYEDFHIWIFFFFVFLGFSGGLFLTSVNHQPRLIVFAAGLLGILPGYIAGIFAGLWAKILGWVSGLLNGLAGIAIIGLVIVDMLMLVA